MFCVYFGSHFKWHSLAFNDKKYIDYILGIHIGLFVLINYSDFFFEEPSTTALPVVKEKYTEWYEETMLGLIFFPTPDLYTMIVHVHYHVDNLWSSFFPLEVKNTAAYLPLSVCETICPTLFLLLLITPFTYEIR